MAALCLPLMASKPLGLKLKDGTLKILELPLLHEVDTPMAKEPEHEEKDEDEDELT